ncbi:hypothetical protein J3F84DRAFT_388123 [Trichoderma pleuroticola]
MLWHRLSLTFFLLLDISLPTPSGLFPLAGMLCCALHPTSWIRAQCDAQVSFTRSVALLLVRAEFEPGRLCILASRRSALKRPLRCFFHLLLATEDSVLVPGLGWTGQAGE